MRVSRALNSPQLVRPKTAEKVMQAVADYLLKKVIVVMVCYGPPIAGLLDNASPRSYRTNST